MRFFPKIFLILVLLFVLSCGATVVDGDQQNDSGQDNQNGGSQNESDDEKEQNQDEVQNQDQNQNQNQNQDQNQDQNQNQNQDEGAGGEDAGLTALSTTADDWEILSTGYGAVAFDAEDGIVLAPMAETSGETHAAWVLAKDTMTNPVRDFIVELEVRTEEQLRTPTPNPWEVFWIFFNYNSIGPGLANETNYFIFKPNGEGSGGYELGRAFEGGDEQYFFDFDPIVQYYYTIGDTYQLRVEKIGQSLSVSINGVLVLVQEGTTWPDQFYDIPGSLGLYTEDAIVRITSFAYQSLDD